MSIPLDPDYAAVLMMPMDRLAASSANALTDLTGGISTPSRDAERCARVVGTWRQCSDEEIQKDLFLQSGINFQSGAEKGLSQTCTHERGLGSVVLSLIDVKLLGNLES